MQSTDIKKKHTYLVEMGVEFYGEVKILADSVREAEEKADKLLSKAVAPKWFEYGAQNIESIKRL